MKQAATGKAGAWQFFLSRKDSMNGTLSRLLAAGALLSSVSASAALVAEVVDLPVEVNNRFGLEVRQSIKVAVLHDDAASAPQPFLVLGHGRPANGNFAGYKWTSYRKQGEYFVSKGFAVFIPLRVGYGESGGPDVEESGTCSTRNYDHTYSVGGIQTRKVIELARSKPYVAPDKGIVVGQSFGGTLAIEAAARNIPGVLATVNFAGGGGGNPQTRPEDPCRSDLLEDLFAGYGKTAKIPTLWLYSENDRYWGKKLPQEWFAAFVREGGKGEFVQLPPLKDADGHLAFSRIMGTWQPHFERFIQSIGLLTMK